MTLDSSTTTPTGGDRRSTDPIDLAGRAVIVTGASSGIGASVARQLHAAGAHPVLAARRADRLAALSDELDGALAVPTDVTDPDQLQDLVTAAIDRHHRIDGLVNNAGASLNGPLDRVDPAEFGKILQLNVVSVLAATQAVLPAMRKQGFGRIVNISSGTTRRAAVGLGAYASSKSAVNMLSSVLNQELADDGIAVSMLLPSITATEFGDNMFTLGTSPAPAWSYTAPTTSPPSSCDCCAPARNRSTSPRARNNPTSPGSPLPHRCSPAGRPAVLFDRDVAAPSPQPVLDTPLPADPHGERSPPHFAVVRQSRTAAASTSTSRSGPASTGTPIPVNGGTGVVPSVAPATSRTAAGHRSAMRGRCSPSVVVDVSSRDPVSGGLRAGDVDPGVARCQLEVPRQREHPGAARSRQRRFGPGSTKESGSSVKAARMTEERQTVENPVPEVVDDIVVGAGAAGSVVAARLSEDPGTSVLLLESGGPYRAETSAVPGNAFDFLGGPSLWENLTQPQRALGGRRIPLATGRGVGGGSAVNGMGWFHGHPDDYDDWARSGATGWDWAAIGPQLRGIEDHELGPGPDHGGSGPIAVGAPPHLHPLSPAFVAAGVERGLVASHDLNGDRREGVGLTPSNIRDGERRDVVRAYLDPARERPNLTVRAGSHVASVLLDGNRAVGVRTADGHEIRARRHVFLCAGALRTPQILLLSGIGPTRHLADHGIEVALDLPGVGENLHDHPEVPAIWEPPANGFTLDASYDDPTTIYRQLRRGPLSALGQAIAVCRSDAALAAPDLHLFLAMTGRDAGRPTDPSFGVICMVALLTPHSRGTVRLASSEPEQQPLIDPGYLTADTDRARLRAGLRLAAELFATPVLADQTGPAVAPAPGADDATLDAHIDATLDTYWHPVGTARIGTDPMAVVDPGLRVHGLSNLYVMDASVFPSIPRANTQAPTIAVATKGVADLLHRGE